MRPLRHALTATGRIAVDDTLYDLPRDKDRYAAGAEIGHFQIGVDPTARLDRHCRPIFALDFHRYAAAWRELVHAFDGDQLIALQLETVDRRTFWQLQRQNAHAGQIGPMDALKALGDHGAYPEIPRRLRREIAGRTRAVFPPGKDNRPYAIFHVLLRGIIDRHGLGRFNRGWRIVDCRAAFAGDPAHQVLQ